jgi:fructose-specific component phosphotransferase system IIB-like protein
MILAAHEEHLELAAQLLRAAKERINDRDVVHDINNALTLVVVLGEAVREDAEDDAGIESEIAADVERALARADRMLWQLAGHGGAGA